jgi:hypothetical protein
VIGRVSDRSAGDDLKSSISAGFARSDSCSLADAPPACGSGVDRFFGSSMAGFREMFETLQMIARYQWTLSRLVSVLTGMYRDLLLVDWNHDVVVAKEIFF